LRDGGTSGSFCKTFQSKWKGLTPENIEKYRKQIKPFEKYSTRKQKKIKLPNSGKNQKRAIPDGGKIDKHLWEYVQSAIGVQEDILQG